MKSLQGVLCEKFMYVYMERIMAQHTARCRTNAEAAAGLAALCRQSDERRQIWSSHWLILGCWSCCLLSKLKERNRQLSVTFHTEIIWWSLQGSTHIDLHVEYPVNHMELKLWLEVVIWVIGLKVVFLTFYCWTPTERTACSTNKHGIISVSHRRKNRRIRCE